MCLGALAASQTEVKKDVPKSQPQIIVAAAADLTIALKELAADYERLHGTKVELIFGSSSGLFAQIQNGAPYDVFLSADSALPAKLADQGVADRATILHYADGQLALIARHPQVRKAEDLRDIRVQRIAVANPQHAPYGRAAVEFLRNKGLYMELRERLVMGENVAQAVQFVQSGNAEAGVVAYSLVKDSPQLVEVLKEGYGDIAQSGVVLTRGRDEEQRKLAADFLKYMSSQSAQKVLMAYGFKIPASLSQAEAARGKK